MVAQDTQKVIEESVELAEDVVELLEDRVSWLVSNPKAVVVVVSLVGVAAGTALGYLIASKKLSARYEALSEKEIAEAKVFYAQLHKKDEFASPGDLIATLADTIIETEGYGKPVETETVNGQEIRITETLVERPPAAPVVRSNVRNVFATDADAWNEAEELASRGDEPYILHVDEYMNTKDSGSGETLNHEQISFTYYEGDGVLADDKDQVVPDEENLLGAENLTKFGHGSNDPNVVYIRNDSVETDFEVLLSKGTYSHDVLGFDDVIQHSDKRQSRRSWSADE